jgi:hypothetical protein
LENLRGRDHFGNKSINDEAILNEFSINTVRVCGSVELDYDGVQCGAVLKTIIHLRIP